MRETGSGLPCNMLPLNSIKDYLEFLCACRNKCRRDLHVFYARVVFHLHHPASSPLRRRQGHLGLKH